MLYGYFRQASGYSVMQFGELISRPFFSPRQFDLFLTVTTEQDILPADYRIRFFSMGAML